jgi:hypothetical protein
LAGSEGAGAESPLERIEIGTAPKASTMAMAAARVDDVTEPSMMAPAKLRAR